MQHAVNQHFERKKKQKILQFAQSNLTKTGDLENKTTQDLTNELSKEQKKELGSYLERIRLEYLQKILEQVNNQNIEYFENLACEYTLQLEQLESGEASEMPSTPVFMAMDAENGDKNDMQENLAYFNFMRKPEIIKMHLDILYQSVSFISRDKIATILCEYKECKL